MNNQKYALHCNQLKNDATIKFKLDKLDSKWEGQGKITDINDDDLYVIIKLIWPFKFGSMIVFFDEITGLVKKK